MSDFWLLSQGIGTFEGLIKLADNFIDPPEAVYIQITNDSELAEAGFFDEDKQKTNFPPVQLRLSREDFDSDYFEWEPHIFVSERMRDAMALDSAGVRFFEVDASQSAPLPRSKNYQIMEVTATEDVSDPEASDYETDGSALEPPLRRSEIRHLVFRPDTQPEHELFYDRFCGYELFCTEALALRVLKAVCKGLLFCDPNDGGGTRRLCRTLRGVEEFIGWDPITGLDVMELVQGID